ncbi:MAG: mechanosensitive ion channel [Leptolyngbyaceae cyanobacterium MO_188.B28]|nr:mechanosensitive ion channel [Leptolyngbyaceae cyanobacterium MO_188.B28]
MAQVSSENTVSAAGNFVQSVSENFGRSLMQLLAAIAILLLGWLLATLISVLVLRVLKRLQLNQRLGQWLTGQTDQTAAPPVEQWISLASFAIVMVFSVVAFLDTLELESVSRPLDSFLQQVIGYLPNLGGAAILLGLAWVVATVSRLMVVRSLRSFGLDERVSEQLDSETEQSSPSSFTLSLTVGRALYWFIFLLFLPAILTTLALEGSLQPVQALLNEILLILPNILAALLIGVIGWFIARIVRGITTNFLASMGANQLGERIGLPTTQGLSVSAIVGAIVYVLILIPTGISALNKLQITAISEPAIGMLSQILTALPQIFTALLILLVAYVLGRLLARGVTGFLTNVGFNNLLIWLGFSPKSPTTAAEGLVEPKPTPEPASENQLVTRAPAEIAGVIVLVAVMLFAALSALELLGLNVMAEIVTEVLTLAGRVFVGLFVFAVGLYLANLAFNLISSAGGSQARLLGQAARVAIIALVSAMALQQMGIAANIVNLAFGLMLGAIAVAVALAFGLGSRDIAAEQVRSWLSSLQKSQP